MVEWVYGINKAFSGAPSAKITREWIHEKIKHHRPFPPITVNISSDEEDADSEVESDQDSEEDSENKEEVGAPSDSGRGESTVPEEKEDETKEEELNFKNLESIKKTNLRLKREMEQSQEKGNKMESKETAQDEEETRDSNNKTKEGSGIGLENESIPLQVGQAGNRQLSKLYKQNSKSEECWDQHMRKQEVPVGSPRAHFFGHWGQIH